MTLLQSICPFSDPSLRSASGSLNPKSNHPLHPTPSHSFYGGLADNHHSLSLPHAPALSGFTEANEASSILTFRGGGQLEEWDGDMA